MSYEQPPEFGSLEFSIEVPPVSLQAPSRLRRIFKEAVRTALPKTAFLLSGEVEIRVEWFVHERERLANRNAIDLDNILKPLLDAMCGPAALLIDDTQVQSVCCSWIDWTRDSHRLRVEVRYQSDEFVAKDGLVFVETDHHMCFPLSRRVPPEQLRALLAVIAMASKLSSTMLQEAGDWYQAQRVLPVQRRFHKNRLTSFEVVSLAVMQEEALQRLHGGA